ncbi:MAG: hypothetical protein HYY06_07060, partial [Deltaproteobacteria bacterium]|nr:hypothetical protein [Deltaproteobacteria bacterium]
GLPMASTNDMLACLRRSEPVADLLGFLLSDEHLTLRASLGIAVQA